MDLSSLRFVGHADVYKSGIYAASLIRTPTGTTELHYAPDYAGAPIATSLPVSGDPVVTVGGALPPFFSGLLPEGHRLSVLRRVVKTSFDDEFSLLLAVGADVPGDVQVVPHGKPLEAIEPFVDIEDPEVRFRGIIDLVDTVGIPGVQFKASASMANRPVKSRGDHVILKIDPPGHPHLVVNEALHLRGARALGIPVSEFEVVHDSEGTPGLAVTRFDRLRDGSSRAMEDASQVLGIYPANKYSVDATEVVNALAAVTQAPLVAARNLYIQFVFAWLTGNGDLHAKNVSVLQDGKGSWQIAPVYDIPCTALYGDLTLALPIAGRTKNIRLRHWDEFAEAIGLPLSAAHSANMLALRAARAITLQDLPFTGSPLNAAVRELEFRRSELE